jgi:hypothetical protein
MKKKNQEGTIDLVLVIDIEIEIIQVIEVTIGNIQVMEITIDHLNVFYIYHLNGLYIFHLNDFYNLDHLNAFYGDLDHLNAFYGDLHHLNVSYGDLYHLNDFYFYIYHQNQIYRTIQVIDIENIQVIVIAEILEKGEGGILLNVVEKDIGLHHVKDADIDTGIPAISLGDGGLFSTFGFSTFFSSLSGVFFLYLPSDRESLLYLSSGVLECLRLS